MIITLYAVIAGSAPGDKQSKFEKTALHGMTFNDPDANSDGHQACNENADAIITKAMAERHQEPQSTRDPTHKSTQSSGHRRGEPSGFGKRSVSTFGNQ